MRRVLAVLIALAASACGRPASTGVPAQAAGAATQPRLVVLVVIDQWPAWVFATQRHLFTGGLGRLLREGAVVPAAEIPSASTFTAPGHAAIATGAPPRVHGIVGNYWHRRDEGRERAAEHDPDATVLVVGAPIGRSRLGSGGSASGRALRVEGIADSLRAATQGRARSVAIALKPRAACLVTGKRPDLAIWYDAGAGGMTTSSAYATTPPAWLVAHAAADPVQRYFERTWIPTDAAVLARATGIADDAPGEDSSHGFGPAFPHDLSRSDRPERAIQQTPFADEMVAATAVAAIDAMALGQDAVPDLLALSFGAHDYAGHDWGPDSWEVLDVTLRLDATLGALFATLDERIGVDRWAALVTSDHGATPLVERAGAVPGRRVPPREIEGAAERAIVTALGRPGPWVATLVASNLYTTATLASLPAADRSRALDAAVAAVASVPDIVHVGRNDRFSADCSRERDLDRAFCIARVPGDAGELYVYPAAGSVITEHDFGTGHDAPVDDNRRIPILLKAPGLARQEGAGSQLQIAPTVAALLGVPPPPAATEPPLFGLGHR